MECISLLFRTDANTELTADKTLIGKGFYLFIGRVISSIGHAVFIYSHFICAILIPTLTLLIMGYVLIEGIPRFNISSRMSAIAHQIGLIAGSGFSGVLSRRKAMIFCVLTATISVNLYMVAYAVMIYAMVFYMLFFVVYVWIELELSNYFCNPFHIVLTWKKAFVYWSLSTMLAVQIYMNLDYYFELFE